MRVALVLLAALGSAMIGRSISSSCLRRARTLRDMMDALQILRIQMLERLLPLHAALKSSRYEPLRLMGDYVSSGEDATSAWQRALPSLVRRGGMLDCLAREDVAALTSLFNGLGTGSRTEQEALLSSALRELGRLQGEADKLGAEKGKLYTTLGLLCGLMLAIAFV